jgi:hypothetical protein
MPSRVPAGTDQPRSPDPKRTRHCTFPGHEGSRDLPATEDYFPVRKSGPRAGSFLGWCRACQKLSAERYKAEPERQGIRSRKERAESTRPTTAHVPGPGRRSPRRSSLWVARPPSELPASRLAWARGWFERLGVRGESDEYLTGVKQWRAAWKPRHLEVLLVAASHVAELDGDDGVRVRINPALNVQRGLPDVYVRLVYCLGFGNDQLCHPRPPQNNAGTDDYWEIFERIALTGERHAALPLPAEPTRRQIAILERLAERGIWLEDASPVGLYLPGGGRLTDPSTDAVILQEGWSGYVWPNLAVDRPEHIWVIGRMVSAALQQMDGIAGSRCIMQPAYAYARWRRREGMWERYQAELDDLAQHLALDAP